MCLGVEGAVIFGIGFLQAGYTCAWGFFPLAGSQLLIVVLYAPIAPEPFE